MTKTSVPGESDSLATDRGDARRRIRLRRPPTVPISDEVDDTGLREKVTRGLGWKLLTVTIAQVSQSFVAILLAHLLVPQDFGLAGMALAFSGIATILTDLSLGAALVQRRVLTERDRSTVFWTTAAGGLLWCLVGIGISPLVADFFREPQVAPLFAAVSVGFLFTALAQTQTALLTREMRFRSLQLRQIAATLVGAVVAVALALAGAGPWAIIAQLLCTYGISAVLLWTVSPWRPQFIFSRESFRTLGSFGVKSLVSKLLLYINLNGDNLLIGRFLGTEALGIYAVAYNVMLLPMSRVTMPIRDVFYAAFARLQHDQRRLGDAWLRVNRLASAVVVPAFVGLLVVAPDFVPVVLGSQWDSVIPVLQLLSLAGIAQSFQSFNGNVYQAYGRPGLFLTFMLFSTTVTFGGFVIGLHWGVAGVAGSFAVARTIVLFANTWQMCRLIKLSLARTFRSYVEVLWKATFMGIVIYLSRVALIHWGTPAWARLLILTILGAGVYFGLVARWSSDLIVDLRTALRRKAAQQPA